MITVDTEEHLSGGEARCLTPSHSSPALRARPLVGCGWWYPVRVSSRGVRRRPTVRVHGRRGRRRLVQCYKGDLRLSEGHFCRAYKTLGERAHTESTQRRGARAYRVRIILWAGGSRVEVGRDQARRGEISLEGRTRPGQPRLGRSHCRSVCLFANGVGDLLRVSAYLVERCLILLTNLARGVQAT